MIHAQAQARHAQLVEEIRQHDRRYYIEAQPSISDREYDKLYHELAELEQHFPDLQHPTRPLKESAGSL